MERSLFVLLVGLSQRGLQHEKPFFTRQGRSHERKAKIHSSWSGAFLQILRDHKWNAKQGWGGCELRVEQKEASRGCCRSAPRRASVGNQTKKGYKSCQLAFLSWLPFLARVLFCGVARNEPCPQRLAPFSCSGHPSLAVEGLLPVVWSNPWAESPSSPHCSVLPAASLGFTRVDAGFYKRMKSSLFTIKRELRRAHPFSFSAATGWPLGTGYSF